MIPLMKNLVLLTSLAVFLLCPFSRGSTPSKKETPQADSIYTIPIMPLIGSKETTLAEYQGKVLLIVNTASHCGYTPQYKGLQELYQNYHDQGLNVLAFPSNDFNGQEPGTATEIKNFCEMKYKVTFPIFDKKPVSGKSIQPLFQWLISHDADSKDSPVKWNFEKFLISREGKLLARFRSNTKPESDEVKKAIESALKK